MALDNVLALFLLPLLGSLSDKVNTPIGKRTPFIIGGTAVAVLSLIFIPIADKGQNLFLFIALLGVVLIAMGTYRSPAVALMPDLTPKPLRSKANAVINLMGAVGAVYTLLMVKVLVKGDTPDYQPLFLTVAGLMVLAVVVLVVTINEKKLSSEIIAMEAEVDIIEADKVDDTYNKDDKHVDKKVDKNDRMPKEVRRSLFFILASIFLWFTAYNAVTTAFSRYVVEVWKLEAGGFTDALLVATVAAILSYLPIGQIASKIGRKKTIIGGIILMTASYFAGSFFTEYSPLINVVFAFTGIGWAAISVNSLPMVLEMCKLSDTGKYTGIYYTTSMSAQILTPIISGALLENVSYRTLFPYAVIFSFASLCTMLMVKHGDSKPVKKANAIENFDTVD